MQLVVPGGFTEPAQVSGGNVYDRRVADELSALGLRVIVHAVGRHWPRPDRDDRAELGRIMHGLEPGAVVVMDGLIASCSPEVVIPAAGRQRILALIHLPLGIDFDLAPARPFATDPDIGPGRGSGGPADDRRTWAQAEAAVLHSVAGVIATSGWTRDQLLMHYRLPADRVQVVEPGTDRGRPSWGSSSGGQLLCVAAVTRQKGLDLLLDALPGLAGLPGAGVDWRLTCVGSLDRDRAFVQRFRRRVAELGLAGRVTLTGVRTGAALELAYRRADLLVVPSRLETWGMVATEAVAHGVPVVAAAVGGLTEALGRTAAGPPGLLVVPESAALTAALTGWLTDPALRIELRRRALLRRAELTSWSDTARRLLTNPVIAGLWAAGRCG